MGNTSSNLKAAAAEELFDWGVPPEKIPEDERDPNELVLQTWVFCKSKPFNGKAMACDDVEERQRRKNFAWRKQSNFIDLDCGEDSFFVADTNKVVGVADGVGGWRKKGVDSSLFSNALMENAKLFVETHRKELDPEVILDLAYQKLLHDNKVEAGSSTACIATLRQEEDGRGHYLDVANLGDSGLLVVRDRQVYFRVHEKVHRFNAPFQLAVTPPHLKGRNFSDCVGDCVRESTPVQEGDVIVMGTDGLFDNRFSSDLAADAGWIGHTRSNVLHSIPFVGFWLSAFFGNVKIGYVDPYRVAQRIVADAYKTSLKKDGDSPWAAMLRHHGSKNAKGGKTDDVTVVLGRVSRRESLMENAIC